MRNFIAGFQSVKTWIFLGAFLIFVPFAIAQEGLAEEVYCDDATAVNVGSYEECQYVELCDDTTAVNYGFELPCEYITYCDDSSAVNYGSDGECIYEEGCTDTQAVNYGSGDSCIYEESCDDPAAENYGDTTNACYYAPTFLDGVWEFIQELLGGLDFASTELDGVEGIQEIILEAVDSEDTADIIEEQGVPEEELELTPEEESIDFSDVAEASHTCPNFALTEDYELCNTESVNSSVPLVFTNSCDDSIIDNCYYRCINGASNIDCLFCSNPDAINYNQDGACVFEVGDGVVLDDSDDSTDVVADTISPEFLTQTVLGIQTEGIRLRRELEAQIPGASNGIIGSEDNKPLVAGEIQIQIFATDSLEDEEGSIVSAEIDWVASNILIQRFVNNTPEEFTCQGQTKTEIPVAIQSLATEEAVVNEIGSIEFNGTFEECFILAGDYRLTIQLVDRAGNHTTKIFENTIVPGSAFAPASGINVACDQDDVEDGIQYPKANNTDACDLEVVMRDQYYNIIDTPISSLDFAEAENTPVDANQGISFLGGLSWDSLGANLYQVRAMAPSLRPHGSVLGCMDDRPLVASIEIPEVDAYGDPTSNISELEESVNLRFDPMYTVQPGMSGQIILPGMFQISLEHSLHEGAESIIPESAFYTSIPEDVYDFEEEDLNFPGVNVTQFTTGISTKTTEVPSGDAPFHFLTRTSYQLNGETVSYPSGYVGPDPDLISTLDVEDDVCEEIVGFARPMPISLVGASIEGDALGSSQMLSFEDLGEENLLVLNSLSAGMGGNQMRATLRESLWDYLRSEPELCLNGTYVIEDTADFQGLWTENDVVLFEGCEVQIGMESSLGMIPKIRPPQGQKTLIIRNGNLKVNANMVYNDVIDSLGIVVINDDITPYPADGNIMIHPKVKEFVGTYYADGALFGYDGSSEPINQANQLNVGILTNREEKTSVNARQLVLTGNLISNNTLGGYMIEANQLYDNPYYFSTWEKDVSEFDALHYDLHYVRRFDDHGDQDLCRRDAEGECDENRMAFVIRNDLRGLNFPPPGF